MQIYAAILTAICIVQSVALMILTDSNTYQRQLITELKDEINHMQYELRKLRIEKKRKEVMPLRQ